MRYLILILILFNFSCTKPVYTVYYEKENYTEFTTHPLEVKSSTGQVLKIETSRRCPAQILCQAIEVKFHLSTQNRFEFLKGKDFLIIADEKTIDLNRRDYKFTFDTSAINKDGITGLALERWLVWIDLKDFKKMGEAKSLVLRLDDYQIPIPSEKRENWKTLIDHIALVQTMDDEQQRVYRKNSGSPLGETKRSEQSKQKSTSKAEAETWELVKDSENIEDFKFFLNQYPESPYAIPAKLKLKQLERSLKN